MSAGQQCLSHTCALRNRCREVYCPDSDTHSHLLSVIEAGTMLKGLITDCECGARLLVSTLTRCAFVAWPLSLRARRSQYQRSDFLFSGKVSSTVVVLFQQVFETSPACCAAGPGQTDFEFVLESNATPSISLLGVLNLNLANLNTAIHVKNTAAGAIVQVQLATG